MTTLNWRNATEVRLSEALIPDPASPSGVLDILTGGRVAVDDGVLYIDPRQDPGPDPEAAAYTVTAVPLAGVISFSFQAEVSSPRFRPV
ncbi:hypothetical protein [Streptacidiphilus sp. PAMC 29251]